MRFITCIDGYSAVFTSVTKIKNYISFIHHFVAKQAMAFLKLMVNNAIFFQKKMLLKVGIVLLAVCALSGAEPK